MLTTTTDPPAVCVASKAEQAASPAEIAAARSEDEQAPRRHCTTAVSIASWEGPHWQPGSLSLQPTARMALARQASWMGVSFRDFGGEERGWERGRGNRGFGEEKTRRTAQTGSPGKSCCASARGANASMTVLIFIFADWIDRDSC